MKRHILASALAVFSLACGPSAKELHNRGNDMMRAGKYADAAKAYGAALERTPDDAETHYGMGLALGKMRHYDRAEHHFREALRLRPAYLDASRALSLTRAAIERRAQP
jgi:tetratricopeptide (TPR) repeat protein